MGDVDKARGMRLGDVFDYLGVPDWDDHNEGIKWLVWPPDVFAVVAYVLRESGAYAWPVWDPRNSHGYNCYEHLEELEELAADWQAVAARFIVEKEILQPPKQIVDAWDVMRAKAPTTLDMAFGDDPRRENELCAAMLRLLAASDVSAGGFGLYSPAESPKDEDDEGRKRRETRKDLELAVMAKLQAQLFNESGPLPSTLCQRIDASRAVVLPKMHTPQVGLTLRNLTHNLSLSPRTDVHARWAYGGRATARPGTDGPPPSAVGRRVRNLLLIPWPEVIRPSQFREVRCRHPDHRQVPDEHGYFELVPAEAPAKQHVLDLMTVAERDIGKIDGIVLPEAAVTLAGFEDLRGIASEKNLEFLAAGVFEPSTPDAAAKNYVKIVYVANNLQRDPEKPKNQYPYPVRQQDKHHRWVLDRDQVVRYGLASVLNPARRWWEGIEVSRRTAHFITLDSLLVFTVLICEDLARPEPVGDLVRSVGPNLVIALLADGPQLESRWSSRYATALTDDPGCSVLTLTSLGMSKLSRPNHMKRDNSRVVALWRDRVTGSRQLVLAPGDNALVITLDETREEEWTADGRSDGRHTGQIRLVGVHSIRR